MWKYTGKPKSLRINEIEKNNSFSIKDFLQIKKRWNRLNTFLEKSYINSNINSWYYCNKSDYYLISNRTLNESLLLNRDEFVSVTPYGFSTKNKCEIKKWDVIIWNNWTLWEIALVLDDFKWITNSNVTLLRFNQIKNTYYFVWFFYSQYFKEYCKTISTKSWTQEFITRWSLENVLVPFPTEKNNKNPDEVENLVSLIVQNIIDKEQQIRLKNDRINNSIKTELKENQKNVDCEFKYPRINWIKKIWRFDTWMYERKFYKLETEINNYKRGYKKLDDLWFTTRKWPNLAISVIWKSIYSEKKINNNFKQLILSKDIDEFWWIQHLQYIWNKNKLPELKQFDVLLFARWNIGRVLLIDDFLIGWTSNFDVFFISWEQEYYKKIFLLNYLKYLKSINYWSYLWVWGSGADSLTDYFLKQVNFPLFPDEKQKEIANEYYNKQPKNQNLNFDNYMELEKERNKKLWIFQLNMELFSLKEKLENIIDKIIMEEPIEISFE